QPCEGLGFAAETEPLLGAGVLGVQDHFQGDGAVKTDMPGLVDNSHTAAPQFAQDLETRHDGRALTNRDGGPRRRSAGRGPTRIGDKRLRGRGWIGEIQGWRRIRGYRLRHDSTSEKTFSLTVAMTQSAAWERLRSPVVLQHQLAVDQHVFDAGRQLPAVIVGGD